MTRFLALLIPVILALGGVAQAVPAAELAPPAGEVLLTVDGTVSETNDGDAAVFDRAMIEALPQQEFTTTTIWTDGEKTFTGPLLKDVLDAAGAAGSTLRAVAINDYGIDIPVDSLTDRGPIIAHLMNGEEMSLRDKGPLWVVYPYDAGSEFQNEVIYSRSVWQLERITVRK